MDRAARITGTSSQEIGVFAPSAHKTCNWLLTGANSPFYGRAGVAEVQRARRRIIGDARSRSSAVKFTVLRHPVV